MSNLFSICWITILLAITSSCLLLSFVVATDNVELHATAEVAAATSTTIDDGDSPTPAAVSTTENDLQQPIHNQLIEPDSSDSNEKEKEISFLPNNDDDVKNVPDDIIQVGDSQLHSEASSSFSMEVTSEQQQATKREAQESQEKQKVMRGSNSRNEGSIPIENEGDPLPHVISGEANMFDNQQWQQQQQQQHHITSEEIRMEGNPPIIATKESLPDMLENPPVITLNEVTSTELPVEIFEQNSVESVIISSSNSDVVNKTLDLSDGAGITREEVQKDAQIQKINDSGGKIPPQPPDDILLTPNMGDNSVPTSNIPVPEQQQQQQQQQNASVFTSTATPPTTTTTTTADETVTSPEVNLTAEEIPIPVFSEWAQKQMEAAEKQHEQEVVNSSAQKKNATNGSKQSSNKLRTKNYASPDCGAKIIASNFDAQNTGALLTSSKDEYMLSPCTNRIWFVVELCEAIQAEKIDLANFELFSSSPKNFSVAVSNRFPTREWSNVGRFVADDKRNIQSFDLHPHLFGKFVRVDIHSHYNSEHFCPVSLFRVYGTSEFEAFETENRLVDDIDEYEDDAIAFDQAHIKNENNLFKSASDAVLSIVKKAAEALVKTNTNRSTTDVAHPIEPSCFTPINGEFTCVNCNSSLVSKINHILSCKHSQLIDLLNVNRLRNDIVASQICAKQFSIETQKNENSFSIMMTTSTTSTKQSYFLNLLPSDYVGALCQLVAAPKYFLNTKTATDMPMMDKSSQMIRGEDEEIALNLTIDKKSNSGDSSSSHFDTFDNAKKAIGESNKLPVLSKEEEILKQQQDMKKTKDSVDSESTSSSSSILEPQMPITPNNDDNKFMPKESQTADRDRLSLRRDDNTASNEEQFASSQSSQTIPSTLDVNIYNIPDTAGAAATATASSAEIPVEQSINLPHSQESSSKIEQQTNLDNSEGSGNNYETTMPPSEISSVPVSTGKTDDLSGQKISPDDSSSWESLDSLLSEPQQPTAPTITANGNGNGNSYQYTKIASGAHSESVFIRLSNRIKALERNMSLSGQYLEELSRRYKKQVEELQQSLTKTVRALEDQNRRHSEQESYLMERNSLLRDEIDDLSLQVHACIVLIICVGATVFILFFVGILFYRAIRRQANNTSNSTIAPKRSPSQKSLNRRKSFEDFSSHKTTSSKVRRPSEEAAVLILKECNSEVVLNDVAAASAGGGGGGGGSGDLLRETKRQRKISVCYSNGLAKCTNAKRTNRKLDKKSRNSMDCINSNEYVAMLCAADDSTKITNCNGGANVIRDKKKSLPISWYKQQCLPSGDNVLIQNHHNNNNNTFCSFDEKAILDEDESVNFLPGADLAYNEFMPDGPSGYTVINNSSNRSNVDPSNPLPSLQKSLSFDKKLRRLSSPAFFKSPFGKSNKSKTTPSHQSTSWEWYRLKKSDAHQKQQSNEVAITSDQSVINPRPSTVATVTTTSSNGSNTIVTGTGNGAASQNQLKLINGFGGNRLSPAAATPESSSLSEILSLSGHNNGSGGSGGGGGGGDGSIGSSGGSAGNENPFRILEEAIISSAASAESTASTVSSILSTNGNCNSSGSGSAGSNRSSKKRRTFNKIFKKVF